MPSFFAPVIKSSSTLELLVDKSSFHMQLASPMFEMQVCCQIAQLDRLCSFVSFPKSIFHIGMNLTSDNFFFLLLHPRHLRLLKTLLLWEPRLLKSQKKSCLYLGHNFFAVVYLLLFYKIVCKENGWRVGVWRGICIVNLNSDKPHRTKTHRKYISLLLLVASVHWIISHFESKI